jgi:hypothetical protein
MKGKWTWFSGALLGAVIVFAMLAPAANAQSYYNGKFDLPFEAHWGLATLPAGHYVFQITNNDVYSVVIVRKAETRKFVAYERVDFKQSSTSNKSALLISTRGGQQIVYSLRIAELGQVFVCDPKLAGEAARTLQARNNSEVPLLVAEN